ncbi:MAG: hypothetical protein V2A70_05460 [Candidatus Omnitrophota bacterium]
MGRKKQRIWTIIGLSATGLLMTAAMASPVFAEGVDTLENAFKGGKISGSIGNYFEYVDKDVANNYGWSTTYLDLKYKTAEWNRFILGVGIFAHGDTYNHSKDPFVDPFNVDIEKEVTLPELYLSYGLLEKSSATVGRFDHKKISHIDDNQSEGAYFSFNEVKDLGINFGVMRRFAEIDYDDGEDFGRNNDAQDLDNEAVFGRKSEPYMLFVDGKYKVMGMITFNPYVMGQQGYANVYGMDTDLQLKAGDITYGSNVYYYYVDSRQTTTTNASAYAIAPYVKVGPVDALVGFAKFDDGTAFNRPTWLADYFLPLDQTAGYSFNTLTGSEVYYGKLKYTIGKFWTHVAMGLYSQDMNAVTGDGIKEYEFQAGYNLTKSLSLNVRLFDVSFDHVSNRDYQKIETHVCYKF